MIGTSKYEFDVLVDSCLTKHKPDTTWIKICNDGFDFGLKAVPLNCDKTDLYEFVLK